MPAGHYDSQPHHRHHSFLESLFGSSRHHDTQRALDVVRRSPLDVYADERHAVPSLRAPTASRSRPVQPPLARRPAPHRPQRQQTRPYRDIGELYNDPVMYSFDDSDDDLGKEGAPRRGNASSPRTGSKKASTDTLGAARSSRGSKKNNKLQLCKCIIDAEFHANKDPKKKKTNVKSCIANHYPDPKPDDYGKTHVPACIPVNEAVFKSLKKSTLKNIARAMHVPVPHDQDDFDSMKIKPLREYLMIQIAKAHPKFMVPAFQRHAIQVDKAAHHPHHHFF